MDTPTMNSGNVLKNKQFVSKDFEQRVILVEWYLESDDVPDHNEVDDSDMDLD